MTPEHFEEATTMSINARRNHLVALWAGKQMGLAGERLQRYAVEVHAADYEEQGPADVVRKVSMDLNRANIPLGQDAVLQVLTQSEASARGELLVTD